MALINCPECGNQVSDRAKECPRCGYSISSQLRKMSGTQSEKGSIREKVLNDTAQLTYAKKNHLSRTLIIGIIGTVIIVILIIFSVVRKNDSERKENILSQTHGEILTIENNISNVEEGYKEKVELFGLKGTITYTNTLSELSDSTNTATWQPEESGSDTERIYEDIVALYGTPINDGGTYWSWQETNGLYRIVLQHGNLGINLVVQKERGNN